MVLAAVCGDHRPMSLHTTERTHMTPETRFEPANVNVRIKIAAP
jgi:hypothetical protein